VGCITATEPLVNAASDELAILNLPLVRTSKYT